MAEPNRELQSPSEEYTVEKVLATRTNPMTNEVEFLLKWQGYDDRYNSWEPSRYLNCPGLIAEFRREQERHRMMLPATISAPPIQPKIGFARGLAPEKIVAATNSPGQLLFLMKWVGYDVLDLVPAQEANVICPQIVITFYEEHLAKVWLDENAKLKRMDPSELPFNPDFNMDPNNYPRLQLGEIIAATEFAGHFIFLIYWTVSETADIIPAKIANINYPHIVIKYYEECLSWHPPNGSF